MSQPASLALLPGLLCDAALWRHQLEALRDRADCRVADFTSQSSTAEMAESVLAQMPERFALAGLSMGGYVALEIMARQPQRVTKLALLDTRAAADKPEQTRRRRGLIELAEKGRFKGVTPRLLPLLIHRDRLADTDLVEEVTAMAERIGKEAFLRQQKAIMTRRDHRALLPEVTCPTLVLCGRQDALTPLDEHHAMAAAIPGARLEVIEDCGHLAPLERPEAVTPILGDWLRG